MRHRISLLLVAVLLAGCAVAFAQSGTVNPTTATFTASPDHATATVTSYALEFYNGATLAETRDVGKPTPTNGTITVTIARGALQQNVNYTVKAVAKGPGGEARSVDASDPFVFLGAPAAPGKVLLK